MNNELNYVQTFCVQPWTLYYFLVLFIFALLGTCSRVNSCLNLNKYLRVREAIRINKKERKENGQAMFMLYASGKWDVNRDCYEYAKGRVCFDAGTRNRWPLPRSTIWIFFSELLSFLFYFLSSGRSYASSLTLMNESFEFNEYEGLYD